MCGGGTRHPFFLANVTPPLKCAFVGWGGDRRDREGEGNLVGGREGPFADVGQGRVVRVERHP